MPTTLTYPEAPLERGRGARVDGELKVSGQLLYADDLALPGLLSVSHRDGAMKRGGVLGLQYKRWRGQLCYNGNLDSL